MTKHVNQSHGPFVAIPHPAAEGRERELRILADEVRRLIEATVTNTAPADVTSQLSDRLREITDELEKYIPVEPLPRFTVAEGVDSPHARMIFDFVHGIYNPLALPVQIQHDPPRALGRGTFTTPYEGPPGCVHGAVLAGVFDMVLSGACGLIDAGGPTVRLALTYRRPTLLGVETVFEGWVEQADDRRTHTIGRALQHGEVTVEAEGTFARLSREQIARLGERR